MRKLALIGDSHGNYQALKAVLEDAHNQNVDDYIVWVTLPIGGLSRWNALKRCNKLSR